MGTQITDILVKKTVTLMDLGLSSDAFECYNEVLKIDPNNILAKLLKNKI